MVSSEEERENGATLFDGGCQKLSIFSEFLDSKLCRAIPLREREMPFPVCLTVSGFDITLRYGP